MTRRRGETREQYLERERVRAREKYEAKTGKRFGQCRQTCNCGAPIKQPTGKGRKRLRCHDCTKRRIRQCTVCGLPARNPWSPYCEQHIGVALERRRDRYAKKYRARRARLAGVPSEPYTLQEIGDRDGWLCHICGKKVRSDLSGLHRNGPTFDHLIPLSKNGPDLKINIRIAHRRCNVAKQDRGGNEQLLLVG